MKASSASGRILRRPGEAARAILIVLLVALHRRGLADEAPASLAASDEAGQGAAATTPFVRDSKLTLHLRTFYYDGAQSTGTESEAWAGGGWLGYRSGWLLDTFAVGAIVYGSAPFYAPADKDGTLLLGPGQKGYYALGEAWAALRYGDYAMLKGYRQSIDQD